MLSTSVTSTVLRRRLAAAERSINAQERVIERLRSMRADTCDAYSVLYEMQTAYWSIAKDLADAASDRSAIR